MLERASAETGPQARQHPVQHRLAPAVMHGASRRTQLLPVLGISRTFVLDLLPSGSAGVHALAKSQEPIQSSIPVVVCHAGSIARVVSPKM